MSTIVDNIPNLVDPNVDFEDGFKQDQKLLIRHTQDIPTEFVDALKAEKAESTSRPAGNFHRFASIPVVVYEKWVREGFDPVKEPAAKVMAKLSAEGLDHFITTGKRL